MHHSICVNKTSWCYMYKCMTAMSDTIQPAEVGELQKSLSDRLSQYGLECYPFLISWYNDKVDASFHLQYPDDTVAFCIVSIPQMFDKAFKPFMADMKKVGLRDPIDECMAFHFKKAKEELCNHQIDTIQDFEMHPNRKPKLLVQTAGHVSGAAYYYQRIDVNKDPWPTDKKIFGVSIHPKFGGWFAFRGALIFKNLQCPNLPKLEPAKVLTTDETIIDLLDKLNNNWRDNSYRDVAPVQERYSEEQIKYFDTKPKDRAALLGLEKEDTLNLEQTRDMGQ